jgi:Cu-Zn family superoxide dismutase
VTAAGVTLTDVVGLSLVVHAGRDDEKTDPAGNSGARVACGVIVK